MNNPNEFLQRQKSERELRKMGESVLNNTPDINSDFSTVYEARAKVSSKGQVVIPIDIRRRLGIEDGESEVTFRLENGTLTVEVEEEEQLLTPEQLRGILDRPEEDGNYVLDLEAAREERAKAILEKPMQIHVAETNLSKEEK